MVVMDHLQKIPQFSGYIMMNNLSHSRTLSQQVLTLKSYPLLYFGAVVPT